MTTAEEILRRADEGGVEVGVRGGAVSINGRLGRLESASRKGSGRCGKCGLPPDGPGRIVLIDDGSPEEGFPDDPEERCGSCGRRLWYVLRVVYEGDDAA